MSSVLEVRIARTGRLHDRPVTGKGSAGERMCSAFIIFSNYEAAKLMSDYWHDSKWQELGGFDLVCKVEALPEQRGRGGPPQRPVVQEEPQSQQCPFAPPAQQHVPQHSGYYYPQTMPLPVPPPPPQPPPFVMMGQQFHHGMVRQQCPPVVMMPQPQQYYPGPPPPLLRPPSGGPPLAGAQFIARPNRNAVVSQCQANNASVGPDGRKDEEKDERKNDVDSQCQAKNASVGPDGRKDEEKDDRKNDGNHKVENTQEEQKEELTPGKTEEIAEQQEKEDVKENTPPPLLEVKEEDTSSPTIVGPEELDDDDDDDDKQVEHKWRQSAEDSEEHDDEEMKKRLNDAMTHDGVVATDDPYIEIEAKNPTPWTRRMVKRLLKQAEAKGGEKEPSLPPLEHPELEVKMESDNSDEARSRGTHGCEKKCL